MNVNLSPGAMNKKGLVNKLMCGCKIFDDFIMQFYMGMTTSFDSIIHEVEVSSFMRKILHSKQILFYLFHFSNFLLIYHNFCVDYKLESDLIPFELSVKRFLYYSFISISCVIMVLILILKLRNVDDMYLMRNEEMEKYILEKNKELTNNQCLICKVSRCMRSFHCATCNKCVLKYEMHSDWFHICIGSMNCFIYALIILALDFYFLITLLNIGAQIFYFGRESEFYDLTRREFIFHSWFITLIYLSVKMFNFTYDFVYMGIVKNLTDYEGYNWRRLPYLWKSMRKDYFNPFDKGCSGNLKELFLSCWNPKIKLTEKIKLRLTANENLGQMMSQEGPEDDILILDMNKPESNENKPVLNNSTHVNNLDKPVEPFTPSDNSIIYRQYNGEKDDIINWTRIRFYTVFDLKNSPFRDVVLRMQQSGM